MPDSLVFLTSDEVVAIEVDDDAAHQFLIGLLERREADLAHLLPWLSDHLVET